MNTFDPKSGGPAFPDPGNTFGRNGMSLRDWFAGQALAAICGDDYARHSITPQQCAQWAYQFADAMLAERQKGGA